MKEILRNTDLFASNSVYLVGGAVREIVRGYPEKVKDWDFSVEAESFEQMKDFLTINGFEIFLETPQYFTIRARSPKENFTFAGIDMSHKTFDFTLCRTEGDYSDGRRPDNVTRGSILEDLSRRDFTMNAIAMDVQGNLIDPYNGQRDIEDELIRCVGSAKERFEEDALRMLRAIRFSVQLGFDWDNEIESFLRRPENARLLENVSEERIREELFKCFKSDTLETLLILENNWAIKEQIFKDNLWLEPTLKGRPQPTWSGCAYRYP
jgi:tRNA nucleotidyltransferase (CCA-adding enzyme)